MLVVIVVLGTMRRGFVSGVLCAGKMEDREEGQHSNGAATRRETSQAYEGTGRSTMLRTFF